MSNNRQPSRGLRAELEILKTVLDTGHMVCVFKSRGEMPTCFDCFAWSVTPQAAQLLRNERSENIARIRLLTQRVRDLEERHMDATGTENSEPSEGWGVIPVLKQWNENDSYHPPDSKKSRDHY